MTTTTLAHNKPPALDPATVQSVLLSGDLTKLTPEQRTNYYHAVCRSLGLNPLTQPFAYLKLSGRELLYAKKDCTDQLRFIHNISIDKELVREVIEDVYIVTAVASMPSGRSDVSTGAVPISGLKGESRANAMMKCETKAKRRVTLSICGLGMLDETEIETIPDARVETGAATVPQPQPPLSSAAGTTRSATVTAPTERVAEGVITNTQVMGTDDKKFYEITLQTSADGFTPGEEHVLLTTDEEAYNVAAKEEGLGVLFIATWKLGNRPNGKIGKLLQSLEPSA